MSTIVIPAVVSGVFAAAAAVKAAMEVRAAGAEGGHLKAGGAGLWAKRFLFWSALLTPLCLLSIVLVTFAFQIHRINGIGISALPNALQTAGPGDGLAVTVKDGVRGLQQQEEYNGGEFTAFRRAPGERIIYMFGGSSLVLWGDAVFPKEIERRLNKAYGGGFRVFNFGRCGRSSETIRSHVLGSINELRPDLIIIYAGHNDYLWSYRDFAYNNIFLIFNNPVLYRSMEWLHNSWLRAQAFYRHEPERNDYSARFFEWILNFQIEPELLRRLRGLHLIRFDNRVFEKLAQETVATYGNNIRQIIDAAERAGIPLVISTLVSNLEAIPFGIDDGAEQSFKRGLAERDYSKRIKLLVDARDGDFFSGFPRAKSPMNEYIRTLNGGTVAVLDLERELINKGFGFGDAEFADAVHMRDGTHKLVGGMFFEFLNERRYFQK